MNHHEILRILTTNNSDHIDLNQKLERILEKVFSQLTQELKTDIENKLSEANDNCVKWKYLQTILHVLCALKNDILSPSETFMSVNEYRSVKVAIELAISIGILPCLLPGIGADLNKLSLNAARLPTESQTDLEKYNYLRATTRVLTDCYKEISLRPAIISQLGPLLGALFQLAHAPLTKPATTGIHSLNFHMTEELYNQLTSDQIEFQSRLNDLIKSCPLSLIIKELMVLSGLEDSPNWLKRITRFYFINAVIEPNGVMSLINAISEDTFDIGVHWEKLETIAKVIATSHSIDSEKYYNAICTQLLNILSSKTIKYAVNIANTCITALYEIRPDICVEKIFHVIAAPFRIKGQDKDFTIISETQVTESVENLVKCFIPKDGKLRTLPHVLLREITLPLFEMHVKIYQSPVLLKPKVRELLTYILTNEKPCEYIFPILLKHDIDPILHCEYLGESILCQFGPSGGVEVHGVYKLNENEDFWTLYADAFYNLIESNEYLSMSYTNYMFKWLIFMNKMKLGPAKNYWRGHYNELMRIVCQQHAAEKILSNIVKKNYIQKKLFESPEALLSLIVSLFPERICPENGLPQDLDVLYTSLMLVKVIVTDGRKSIDWTPYNNFSNILKGTRDLNLPTFITSIMDEVVDVIKTRGIMPAFQDMSIDEKTGNNFEKALRDLADPLLPVRAHGLMTMTKLIESSDPIAMDKKDLILFFFQENLKEEDSFVYLTAINGLCAMAMSFPQQIIELLVQQFIDMPQRNTNGEIAPENRVKLGEILVKTTRDLGDMAPAYKNILINGFLCGVRDSDSMIRASSLSCLGELCKILGFRLGNIITEVLYCIGCIIQTDKFPECRRAAVLVITLLIRGLGKDVLGNMTNELLPVYRNLKYLRDNDNDDVLRLHAQLALEELDDIVHNILYTKSALEKNIFLLSQ